MFPLPSGQGFSQRFDRPAVGIVVSKTTRPRLAPSYRHGTSVTGRLSRNQLPLRRRSGLRTMPARALGANENMTMSRRLPKRKWPLFAASVAVAGISAALACVWLGLDHLILARVTEDELASAADEDLPDLLRKLADLGEPGNAALVRALESPRTAISSAAAQALEAELDRWSRLSPAAAEPKLVELANRLALAADSLPAPAQACARRLAMRILRWPEPGISLDRADIISACERILNAKPAPKLVRASRPRRGKRMPENKQAAARAAAGHRAKKTRLASWPSPTLLAEQMAAAPMRGPNPAAPLVNEIAEPARFVPGDSRPLAAINPLNELPDVNTASMAGAASEAEARKFERLNTFDVFAKLHDEEPTAQRAAHELTRRGFNARQIEVGRHLTSPDAHERHQWVEALPGIRGVEAKAWLLHLSHDQSLAVRRAAITLLATSRDPEVLRRMAEVATHETDPELRAEAEAASEGLEGLSPGGAAAP